MKEDVEVVVAAAVIESLLCRLPLEKRGEALAKAVELVDAQQKDWEKRQGATILSSEFFAQWEGSPNQRYWHQIKKLKAAVAYTFIRDITNNHSAEDASRLLFGRHGGCPGSGFLLDYLKDLPRWVKARQAS